MPFHYFLAVQTFLLATTFSLYYYRQDRSAFLQRLTYFLTLTLIASTAQGLKWFLMITNGETSEGEKPIFPFELRTEYYVEALVMIGIPVSIASLFMFAVLLVLCVFIYEYRQNRMRRERFEDMEGDFGEEIAETYMRLLEPVTYDSNAFKYMDCSICLKEFEEGELLQKVPNCQHIFHEACLRKWFVQAQICPMCRGNIIRVPDNLSPQNESVNSQAPEMPGIH